jgi:REP element-mobilizing transposase RayT
LGDIANEEMILNWRGGLARQYWERIPEHYPNVKLDKYCIMPDHIHGIICIIDMDDGETRCIEGVKQQRAVGTEQCSVPTHNPQKYIKPHKKFYSSRTFKMSP